MVLLAGYEDVKKLAFVSGVPDDLRFGSLLKNHSEKQLGGLEVKFVYSGDKK